MPTLQSSGFRPWSCGLSSIRRTAVCGPACTVVWQGRRGNPSPYADFADGLFLQIDVCDVVDFLPKEQSPQAFEFFGGISNEKTQGAAFVRDRFGGTRLLASAKRVLDRESRGLGGIDQRDMPRHYALQHRLQQRIVCASKKEHVG